MHCEGWGMKKGFKDGGSRNSKNKRGVLDWMRRMKTTRVKVGFGGKVPVNRPLRWRHTQKIGAAFKQHGISEGNGLFGVRQSNH